MRDNTLPLDLRSALTSGVFSNYRCLLLAESSRWHPPIFAVASVRYTPKAAAQMLESGLNGEAAFDPKRTVGNEQHPAIEHPYKYDDQASLNPKTSEYLHLTAASSLSGDAAPSRFESCCGSSGNRTVF